MNVRQILGPEFRLTRRMHVRVARVAAVSFLLAPATAPAAAHAYNGNAAAAYADNYATSRNPAWPSFDEDCTNFVSQAVHAGGYSFVGAEGNTTNDQNWYMDAPSFPPRWWWDYSHSWTVANDYMNFLYNDNPGGYVWGQQPGDVYSGLSGVDQGDVLFYNWGLGQGVSHVAKDVGFGQDPTSGWWGDYVDEHTSDRRHAFWTLQPYNANAATTQITLEHIDAGNY